MLEGKVLGTKMINTSQIYVKLLDEMVEVWRPISASHPGGNIYKIEKQEIPDYENWEFQPGDTVETRTREAFGKKTIVCIRKIH